MNYKCPGCGRPSMYEKTMREFTFRRTGKASVDVTYSASGEILSVNMKKMRLSSTRWCGVCHFQIR